MNEITFVILGATGDLSKRKILPAIARLIEKKKIKKFAIVAAARRKVSIKKLVSEAKTFYKSRKEVWQQIEKNSLYSQLDFYKEQDYQTLATNINKIEKKRKLKGNRIFYLATLPDHFPEITKNIKKYDCMNCSIEWPRLVFEKPFGHNVESAKKLNKTLAKYFAQKYIYRIDHYLGKELVENISLVRFTNRILEPLWNHKHIESVQINLLEDIGVENRGGFYDKYGAIKDVVQNHMLQLLALIAMEPPTKLFGQAVHNKKVAVLKKTKVDATLLGQYTGYLREKGVNKNSKTETFAALKLFVQNRRWRGVPFFLKTGKALKSKETRIDVKFKEAKCLMLGNCPTDTNYLTIRIQPNEGITLDVHSKTPGKRLNVTTIKLDFCHSCTFGPNSPEAYETLLEDVINGEKSTFVRHDEIEASWKITDSIKKAKRYPYKKGSVGPKQLQSWSKKHKVRWRG